MGGEILGHDRGCRTGNEKTAEWSALGSTALFHFLCDILCPYTVVLLEQAVNLNLPVNSFTLLEINKCSRTRPR